MTDPLERNRENALAFYEMVFNQCQPRKAVDLYVGEIYIQHNPDAGEGKTGFIRYCEWLNREYPGKRAEFLTTVCQGDLVVIQTRQSWPGDIEIQTVDFFRLDPLGKIVEHWDVVQEPLPNN